MIVCQVETKQAVDNIEEIAAVDGVDMLFIGPYDLSGSIKKLALFEDPEVKALFELARDKIKKSGKWLGCIAQGSDHANQLYDDGFDFLLLASETSLVATAADTLLDQLKNLSNLLWNQFWPLQTDEVCFTRIKARRASI